MPVAVTDGPERAESLTLVVRGIDHARTQRQGDDALGLQLCGVFSDDHIQRGLHGAVTHGKREALGAIVGGPGDIRVGPARGNGDDLLGGALQDEREEGIDGVDGAQHVGVEALVHVVVQGLALGGRGKVCGAQEEGGVAEVRAVDDQLVEAGGE